MIIAQSKKLCRPKSATYRVQILARLFGNFETLSVRKGKVAPNKVTVSHISTWIAQFWREVAVLAESRKEK